MSQAHFDDAVSNAKGIPGIIQPSAGPESDVMPVKRNASKEVFGVVYNPKKEDEAGVAAEEVIKEGDSGKGLAARAPFSGGDAVNPLAKGGQHSGQTMRTKDIHTALTTIHARLGQVARNATSVRSLHPDHKESVIAALGHLNDAGKHISDGASTGVGTNTPDLSNTKSKWSQAIKHLSSAQSLLSDDGMQGALTRHNIAGEVPEASHLAEISGHIGSMRGKGAGGKEGAARSFKTVKAGKMDIPVANIAREDLARLRELGGTNHLLVKKIESAIAGTPKDGGELVSEERMNEAEEKGQVRSSRTGVVSTRPNPKKRGTGATARTRISSANDLGKTPTFGESGGGTGKQKGKTPKGLKPDVAKKNPSQNRGGRGGAV